MAEFLGSYGLWIALAAVMIGMHWFGMGGCGGRRHGSTPVHNGLGAQPRGGEKASEASPKSEGYCR